MYTTLFFSIGAGFMYPDASSTSAELFERAQRVLPGGISRHTLIQEPYPIYADHAAGCRVTDVDGVERIDFINNYSAAIHGHAHPALVEAIRQQAGRLTGVGMPTRVEIELAELLVDRLPSVEQLRFCNSGSEAVMFAIRAARAYTGKAKIAKVEGAYHGAYDYAEASLSPTPDTWGAGDPVPVANSNGGTPPGVLADVVVLPFNDIAGSKRMLDRNAAGLAAVLLDPLVSRMGFLEASPAYLQFLREWTRANGALMILDEVFTFRIGYHGAQGRFDVDPDLTALGKFIGGGIPIGAVGGKREVMDVFNHRQATMKVPHGGTYNGNPLAMAAGLAAMNLLTRSEFDRINALGDRLRLGIGDALRAAGLPGRGLGMGSMVALFMDDGAYSEYRGFLPCVARSVAKVHHVHTKLLNRGILCGGTGGFLLSTAMTESVIDETLAALSDALLEFAREDATQLVAAHAAG